MSALSAVVVGHVTNDVLAEGIRPGGAALYAGLAARVLGAEVTLITRLGPDFVGRALLERFARVEALPAARTTTFDERIDRGHRVVRLLAHAGPLDVTLPARFDVLLACPVADEVPLSLLRTARPRLLLAAGLQGWLRAFDAGGTASPRLPAAPAAFSRCNLVSYSEEDVRGLGPELAGSLRAAVPVVAVTRGADGARIDAPEGGLDVRPLPVNTLEATGAGDVFLATLAMRLAAGDSLPEAADWAACAGALTVTGVGTEGVPDLARLSAAVERYRLTREA